MEQIKYPLREAMRAQGIPQKDIIKVIRKSRQTVTRYMNQYERYGSVNDVLAQNEFDRIMAAERQRLSGMNKKSRLETAKAEKKETERMTEILSSESAILLKKLIANHPDIPLHDMNGEQVDPTAMDEEELNLLPVWNQGLIDALTPSERSEWDSLQSKWSDLMTKRNRYESTEEACNLEALWDSTIADGKPVVYDDELTCEFYTADDSDITEIGGGSFCLCSGDTARIFVKEPYLLEARYGVKTRVYAEVYAITDHEIVEVTGLVEFDGTTTSHRYGTIKDLIPGYKYVYEYIITGEGEENGVVLEAYTNSAHPLK